MDTSPDTLLRMIRGLPSQARPTPRVLGVDDWAMRKGQTYGTLLVDLERQAPVEVLADRTAETLAQWLQGHPGVEIISRDRAGAYADGATQGAPHATQVADRFHLLQNVTETAERSLARLQPALERQLAQAASPPEALAQPVVPEPTALPSAAEAAVAPEAVAPPAPPITRAEQVRMDRRARRLARYNAILELRRQGLSIREIARRQHASRGKIRTWLAAGAFPERARRKQVPRQLDPYAPYLRERWQAGCHKASQLYREIQAQGYSGCYPAVSQYVAPWRTPHQMTAPGKVRTKLRHTPRVPLCALPSARRLAFLFTSRPDDRTAEQAELLTRLCDCGAEARTAYDLAQGFAQLIRDRQREKLDAWLASAEGSDLAEFRHFAASLRRDYAAVANALTLTWSNGQVEGQANRLKTLKRQMFGRCKWDLLKQRVLNPV